MMDSQAGQVEGLFSLPIFHDKIVMTMGLSVMSGPVLNVKKTFKKKGKSIDKKFNQENTKINNNRNHAISWVWQSVTNLEILTGQRNKEQYENT